VQVTIYAQIKMFNSPQSHQIVNYVSRSERINSLKSTTRRGKAQQQSKQKIERSFYANCHPAFLGHSNRNQHFQLSLSLPKTEAQTTTVDESRREKWIFNIIVRSFSPFVAIFPRSSASFNLFTVSDKKAFAFEKLLLLLFRVPKQVHCFFLRSLRCLSSSKTYCTSLAISLFAFGFNSRL
jgi:hypothetical protein